MTVEALETQRSVRETTSVSQSGEQPRTHREVAEMMTSRKSQYLSLKQHLVGKAQSKKIQIKKVKSVATGLNINIYINMLWYTTRLSTGTNIF